MARKNVLKIISLYKKDLEKKIKVDKIVLFGSVAKGKINQDSDIDLLVVSSQFSSLDPDERAKLLVLARENPETWNVAMDIFGVTPKEYQNASRLSILGEIKKTGITIKQ
ncbi:MAG: nucleotidyltransferase domain-containing protein [Patescibacteria group bacterium]|nr:nucleotidyltransferase domain-containing protein [Patescibacteria group bacterium]